MPAFADPFVGGSDLSDKRALLRALRLDIAAEHEAVSLYTAHADATTDDFVKKVLTQIADEERVHVGELTALIKYLASDESDMLDKGAKEVSDAAPGFETETME